MPRHYSLHCQEAVAQNVRRVMIFWAGHLFQTAETKSVRHLFVKDMRYWLLRADDDVRIEICRAFAKCGKCLLGRFNMACAQALVEACGPSSSEACRSCALEAVRVFGEADENLYQNLRPHIVTIYRARQGLYRWDVAWLVGHLDRVESERAMWRTWLACKGIAGNIFSNCQQILDMGLFETCALVQIGEAPPTPTFQAL